MELRPLKFQCRRNTGDQWGTSDEKGAGTVPDLWGVVDTADLYAPGGRDEADTVRAEEAVHTALTLLAAHQQSRPRGMHRPGGHELGAAVRDLMAHGSNDEALRKRFVRVGTAGGMPLLATRLREIVLLLRCGVGVGGGSGRAGSTGRFGGGGDFGG